MSRTLKALLKTIGSIILGVTFVFLVNTFPIIMAILLVIALIITVFILFYNEEDQSMNKEEIEHIEEIKKMLNFTTEGTSLKINNEVSKLLLKYIKELEQKESILDKVTDKLKEVDKKYKNEYENIENMELSATKICVLQELTCAIEDIEETLNIIEGENNNGNV